MFWTINFSFDILVVLLLAFIFDSDIKEIFIQLIIAISLTPVLIWTLGGYNKMKTEYFQKQKNKV